MIGRKLFLSIILIKLGSGLPYPVMAQKGFVNSFVCEGNLTSPKQLKLKGAFVEVMASGDGYLINAEWLGTAYSGLAVARQNEGGRVIISFALSGHEALSTVVGIMEQTNGPQGHAIVDALTVSFTEVIKKQKYEVAAGHLMCEVSSLK